MKHSLPDGAWVDLWEPSKCPEAGVRGFRRAWRAIVRLEIDARKEDPDAEQADLATPESDDGWQQVNDTLIVALVADWSFELPIDLASLALLPHDAADELGNLCGPLYRGLLPDFMQPKLGVTADPKAGGGDSNSSSTTPEPPTQPPSSTSESGS